MRWKWLETNAYEQTRIGYIRWALPQDADDDVVDGRVRAKEETALEGSAGDLDESPAFGDEPESSHAR
jgi:hypothetical protein